MKIIFIFFLFVFPLVSRSQIAQIDSAFGDMVHVGSFYVDKYEAPNIAGERPFVMFSYNEASCWCQARGKRLLYDDEWVQAAGGPDTSHYVYGDIYDSSACNDSRLWISPNQSLLNLWPVLPYLCDINSFTELIDSVLTDTVTAPSANEVLNLYQADSSGRDTACVSYYGLYDMNGNAYEWTTRRDGGSPGFHGNMKGGYWSAPATVLSSILSHGDNFRYYYTGFRCASDSLIVSDKNYFEAEGLNVFPNPFTGTVFLEIQEFKHGSSLIIYNLNGQVILSEHPTNSIIEIDLSFLPKGVYIAKLITDNAIRVKRMIKE